MRPHRRRRQEQARTTAANLRLEAGNDPADRATRELIAQLRERSPDFGRWWDEHRVYQRTHGSKRLRHPRAGDLTVEYETLTLPGDPNTTLYVYSAEPDSVAACPEDSRRLTGVRQAAVSGTAQPTGASRPEPRGPA